MRPLPALLLTPWSALVSGLPLASQDAAAAAPAIDEARIAALLEAAREQDGLPGVVAGALRGAQRAVVARGLDGREPGRPLDGDTLFEIGSITKAFTGLLLAVMCERGEVQPDMPLQELLPKEVAVPRRGREITLLDLATHRSSLPRLPTNMKPQSALDPYAGYGQERLFEFLGDHSLRRDVGERYEYSNLGMGLLGHALGLRSKSGYEALLRERVLAPLGLRDTFLSVPDAAEPRLARAHLPTGKPGRPWTFDCLAGCGGLRSTVHDMLRFAACNLGLVDTPLLASLRAAHDPRADAEGPARVGLGWHVTQWGEGDPVVWHNGRTGGYASMLMLRPKAGAAVVVLANRSSSVDELAGEVLRLVCGEKP